MIVGAAVAAASAIGSAIMGANKAKKNRRALENERISNEAWYNRRINEDATQRADAQRVLQRTEDAIRERNKSAAGTQSVMGGTEESLSATKTANANAMANAASQIAAAGSDRKDAIESQYLNRNDAISSKLADIRSQEQDNFAQAVKGVGQAAANLAVAGSSKNSVDKSTNKLQTQV